MERAAMRCAIVEGFEKGYRAITRRKPWGRGALAAFRSLRGERDEGVASQISRRHRPQLFSAHFFEALVAVFCALGVAMGSAAEPPPDRATVLVVAGAPGGDGIRVGVRKRSQSLDGIMFTRRCQGGDDWHQRGRSEERLRTVERSARSRTEGRTGRILARAGRARNLRRQGCEVQFARPGCVGGRAGGVAEAFQAAAGDHRHLVVERAVSHQALRSESGGHYVNPQRGRTKLFAVREIFCGSSGRFRE